MLLLQETLEGIICTDPGRRAELSETRKSRSHTDTKPRSENNWTPPTVLSEAQRFHRGNRHELNGVRRRLRGGQFRDIRSVTDQVPSWRGHPWKGEENAEEAKRYKVEEQDTVTE